VRVSASIDLPRRPLLKRGSTVTLFCNVSVQTTGASQVEVQWLHKLDDLAKKDGTLSEESTGSRLLATLTYDGLTRIYSNGSDLSVDRVSERSYRRIRDTISDPRGGWYNTGAKAESVTVQLYLYARGEL
ncbi:hypothetical protein M9458_014530, partial [Cirrhinus mrigala]